MSATPLSPLQLSVPATRMSEGPAPATLYVVLVKFGDSNSWTVSRRFAEFDVLHAALQKRTSQLPSLPAKTWFKSFDPDFVEQRRLELEVYLQAALKSRIILNAREFHSFLELPVNVHGIADYLPAERIVLKDPKFGVNACVYDHRRGLLLTANEDSFLLSRIDSYISNTRMPWETAPPPLIAVGALNVWARDAANSWSCVLSQYYNSQATAIAWDAAKSHAYVGMDSGMIMVYRIDIEASSMQLVAEINAHSARVTELVYDRTLDRLFSVGRDKLLHIHDVGAMHPISSTKCGEAWLSCLYFDERSQRVLIGTYAQQLLVYSVARDTQSAPMQLAALEGQKGSIRCVTFDADVRYCVTGGFDYSVCMWDIGLPGKEKRSSLVACFRSGPQAKCKAVVYCPSTRLVLAGYENGMIAVYNTKNAEALMVFEAHSGDIVALHWLEEHRILISGARDCDVKFWLFPEDVSQFLQADLPPPVIPLTAQELDEDLDLQRQIAAMNLAASTSSLTAAAPSAESTEFSSQSVSAPQYTDVVLSAAAQGSNAPASAVRSHQ